MRSASSARRILTCSPGRRWVKCAVEAIVHAASVQVLFVHTGGVFEAFDTDKMHEMEMAAKRFHATQVSDWDM
jgi:L-asparaginase/Glu-tRNA(Gln) amidotransferase subunit D